MQQWKFVCAGEALLKMTTYRAIEKYVRCEHIKITAEVHSILFETVEGKELSVNRNSKTRDVSGVCVSIYIDHWCVERQVRN